VLFTYSRVVRNNSVKYKRKTASNR